MTPATLLPDIELQLQVEGGMFAPKDYDERFHGPVRLREALASSLNVPAVWTANELGAAPLLDRLHAVGFESLDASADHYGPGLALGDGEVTLLELTNAYAAMARGGVWKRTRAVESASAGDETRVMPAAVADELADMLSDHASAHGGVRRDERARPPVLGRREDGHVQGVPRQLDGRLHARSHGRCLGR